MCRRDPPSDRYSKDGYIGNDSLGRSDEWDQLPSGSQCREAEGGEEAMRDVVRMVLALLCGLFAVVVGGLAVVGIVQELSFGQAHGPSAVVLGLIALTFANTAGWAAWRLSN